MPSEPSPPQVEFTLEFKRNLRALSKKYRHIRSDLQAVLEQLQADEFIGDRIAGTRYTVFKVRVRNSDIQKGKRAGYRLIYQVKTPTLVILVTLYSKLDQADISAEQIRRILTEFDEEFGSQMPCNHAQRTAQGLSVCGHPRQSESREPKHEFRQRG